MYKETLKFTKDGVDFTFETEPNPAILTWNRRMSKLDEIKNTQVWRFLPYRGLYSGTEREARKIAKNIKRIHNL